jgi:LPS-assembly protein
VLSAAYRVQRPVTTGDSGSQQFDIGWQWPINDLWGDRGQDLGPGRGQGGQRWYSVGRLNYSATDGRLVDGVLGLEYDGCCWIARAVLQRSFSGLTRANTQIMLQLELVGFSRIGNNPLGTLKNNITRYQFLRDQVSPPSRFSNYD